MKRFLALVNGNADSKSLFLCCVSADSFKLLQQICFDQHDIISFLILYVLIYACHVYHYRHKAVYLQRNSI